MWTQTVDWIKGCRHKWTFPDLTIIIDTTKTSKSFNISLAKTYYMEETLKRIESKVDKVLELLEDLILTDEEIKLIKEADEIVKKKEFDKLVKL